MSSRRSAASVSAWLVVVFWRYQEEARRWVLRFGFGVAVQRVPGDRDRLRGESERDGALDGFLDPVAGVADALGFGFLVGVSIVQRVS